MGEGVACKKRFDIGCVAKGLNGSTEEIREIMWGSKTWGGFRVPTSITAKNRIQQPMREDRSACKRAKAICHRDTHTHIITTSQVGR